MWTYFWLWFPMLLLAVLNGAAREVLYKASLGDLRAHQLSTVTLLILFSIYIWLVIRFWTPESSQQALLVGLLWLVLTLAFEFGFGSFVGGRSWAELVEEYNLLVGRVWIFIPVWVAIGPYIFYRLQE
ncbi:hypothetical protein EHM92_01210 [bacterium]|nr:MAG: hypothetical protein EHM92_01210 [bacterium]